MEYFLYNNHFVFSDFGLTDFPQKTTKTDIKEHVGPWQTIAPEMERDVENADFKAADIYSFAKTFWMIITKNKDCFEGQYSFTTDYMDLSKYIKTRSDYYDGKKIYFEEYGIGKKPTLVYMHGGPGESCLTYTYQAQKLGEYFHVISFDQYGVFRSDAIPEETKAPDMSAAMAGMGGMGGF